jgi:hypothetical protein
MKYNFLLTTALLFTFSILSFGQLDSIYHQGPSQGSQPTGSIQNTDNFPTNLEIIPGIEPRVIPPIDTRQINEPMFMDYDESNLPEYVYIQDANAVPNENPNFGANGGSVLLNSFQGFVATNAIPPDPSMAVGPNHIIATVNGFPSLFRIF